MGCGIADIVDNMDEAQLRCLVLRMAEEYGKDDVGAFVTSFCEGLTCVDPENVFARVAYALSMDAEEFYSIADKDDCGNYIDPREKAAILVKESIVLEFRREVELLMEAGREEDAIGMTRSIADSLRVVDSVMVDFAQNSIMEYANALEKAADEGDPVRGFEW